jgi:outer membrane receptor for ferrienterochelin and colicins
MSSLGNHHRHRLVRLVAILVLSLGSQVVAPPRSGADQSLGILVIAHGGSPAWNAHVHDAVAQVRRTASVEVAFLMGPPDATAQAAYDRLVAAGARRIAVVPLLVSSFSAHAEQVRFIAGLRPDYPHADHMALAPIRGPIPITGVAPAMDAHPLVAAILVDRARRLAADPSSESLVIVAHGPNEDDDAARWLETMRALGAQVRAQLPFRDVDVRLLRDDAPKPVKDRALAELRSAVAERAARGRVVVVPLLLAPGKTADQIPEVLAGLSFAWDGRTLLPDDRIASWILEVGTAAAAGERSAAVPPPYREEIVVTATRTARPLLEVPVHTEVVNRDALEAVGARSVADALSRQLGVEVVPTLAGDGIQLQGVDSRGVLILVDGQKVIGKVGGSVDLGNLLVEDVERIEIVKGAASALYGSDALGGVVNILTRSASRPFVLSAEQRFESLDGRTSFASAGGRRARTSWFATASRVSRDAYDLSPQDEATTGSAYRKLGFTGKYGRRVGTTTDLSVVSRYYDEDAADVTVSRGAVSDDHVFDERWQTISELRTTMATGAAVTLRGHVTTYRHDFVRTSRSTGGVSPDLTSEFIREIELQHDRPIGLRHLVTAGGELEHTGMTSDRIEGRRRRLTTGVLFVQDEWMLHDRLRLVGGVRYDRNSAFGDAWSPKLAALVHAATGVRLRASYGEGFKAPEFKDLYFAFSNRAAGYQILGNPDLRPETSRSLTASVELEAWDTRARVTATGFRHAIRDLIDSAPVLSPPGIGLLTFQTANIGRVQTQGIEIEGTVTPVGWARFELGYGWLDALARPGGEPLTLRARHTIKGRVLLQARRHRVTLALFARHLGRRPFADTDQDGRIDDVAPPIDLWDVRLAKDIGAHVRLFAGAENVLAERDARYFPSPGRRIFGGAIVRYAR